MINSLKLENFTLFQDNEFNFSPGLNVFVGENSTGKTHILKIVYAIWYAHISRYLSRFPALENSNSITQYLSKIEGVFKTGKQNLVGRHDIKNSTKIALTEPNIDFEFNTKSSLQFEDDTPNTSYPNKPSSPIFLPAKEILSIYPKFTSLYEEFYLAFDETYYDLCKTLNRPLRKKLNKKEQSLIQDLEVLIDNAKVIFEGDRFYLKTPDMDNLMDIHMVAEGHRKIATLIYLIQNDSLKEGVSLFWDEPESNLNPQLIKFVAKAILALTENGIQVFIATHSLFLLRELEILTSQSVHHHADAVQFFGFHKNTDVGMVVEQGNSLDDVGDIAALDEELIQSDRFMQIMVAGH
ncbi:AAA family ATPase [Candidatus Venteria ishoeyi]|uniref:AAA family ATPase n=1 Tax=Candidatus Venteria ishoeyi TaxID=1899563 RepID=UPI0025A61E6E|nr:ATP-binding protein [Candidatus Venteria ishoeyi]MDM8546874.1 AAA family ATPase [Candidatus Venteria ishoeyi]